MGNGVLAIYLGGVTACALAFGAAINAIYTGLGIDPSAVVAAVEGGDITVLQTVAVIALAAVLGYHLWRRLLPGAQAKPGPDVPAVLR